MVRRNAQEINAMTPARAQTRTPKSGVQNANHYAMVLFSTSGLTVSVLASGLSGLGSKFKLWSETLHCILEQDMLLSKHLSSPRFMNGYRQI